MKGIIAVTVQNNRVQYKFELRRNLTILRGNSGTGKTTLIEMLQAHENNPDSGITVVCEKACCVIAGEHWKEQLKGIHDSIVYIDEGNRFLTTTEFAEEIRNTDNYYVIATRHPLPTLPYSVDEVYSITNKTKGYGKIKRIYSGFKNLYSVADQFNQFDLVIVEDSNAGYTFFKNCFEKLGISCISARGKSNIANEILKTHRDAKILVIADGAAFGPEMETVLKSGYSRNLQIYLPESFEWLILKSGLIDGNQVKTILKSPSDYIESKEYFSWERFFNTVLMQQTKGTYLAYNKRSLNMTYLQDKERIAILAMTPFPNSDELRKEKSANSE